MVLKGCHIIDPCLTNFFLHFSSLSLSDSPNLKIFLSSTRPCYTWDTIVESPRSWLQMEASEPHRTTTSGACRLDLLLSQRLSVFPFSQVLLWPSFCLPLLWQCFSAASLALVAVGSSLFPWFYFLFYFLFLFMFAFKTWLKPMVFIYLVLTETLGICIIKSLHLISALKLLPQSHYFCFRERSIIVIV